MFGFLKNMFAPTDNSKLEEAIINGAFLVDVRTPSEFSSASVSGAVNIPLDQVANKLVKFRNNKSIVVFCLSGNRSSRAKNILEQHGFQNVIDGGAWKNVNLIVKKQVKATAIS